MPDSPLDALQKLAKPRDVEQTCGGICPCCFEQNVVRIVAPQHVVDEIGRHRDLPAGFYLAGMTPLDQPGDDGCQTERALHQTAFGEPGIEIVAKHVLLEQFRKIDAVICNRRRDVAAAPDRQRVIVGDETKRGHLRPIETTGQQHAEGLMRETALEWINDDVVAALAWKCFDQNVVRARQDRALALQFEPMGDRFGKRRP